MKALITGALGQDGFYLTEFLLAKGYEVIGTRRGTDDPTREPPGARIVYGDITDAINMRSLMERERPDEVYNLAAITHVGDSFEALSAALTVDAIGAGNVLDAATRVGAKFYQASTSEMFGDSHPPQTEETRMRPRSPYGIAKLAAYWLTRNYRERGHFAVNGILFNHESIRRKNGMVTQKVARGVAAIMAGDTDHITLGNLDARRDWGHPIDYVRGMWMMLQADKPDDYVLATGISRSVRDLCKVAFGYVGLPWQKHVRVSQEFFRPTEVDALCGDARKAREELGWECEIGFEQIIDEMVEHAMREREALRKAA